MRSSICTDPLGTGVAKRCVGKAASTARGSDRGRYGHMGARDFQITARIRRVLLRRSVDDGPLEFGSVDGVAYLRGPIRRLPGTMDFTQSTPRMGSLLTRLEEDLERIDGVYGVVLEVPGYRKVDGEWKPIG